MASADDSLVTADDGDVESDRSSDAKSRDRQQQSKALDSITDYAEEKQLNAKKVQQAMASISASAAADKEAQRAREKELASVKIDAAHVDLIATEFEVDKKVAERRLREHHGDAVAAMRSFLVV